MSAPPPPPDQATQPIPPGGWGPPPGPPPPATPKAADSVGQSRTTTTEVEVTTTVSTYDTPEPSDFELTVKTLSKQCFGSAGCNVTYRIQAGWDGTYDPDKTYEVVYEVRGDESGPQTNNFTITGDEYQVSQEEDASTRSSGVKLTARVISVEEQ
jgi:hypothetical protein